MPESKPIPKELIALIQVQPILQSLPQNSRDELIGKASLMTFGAGETMIREDVENGFLFLLLKGEAIAVMNGTEAGRLEAGDVAGEISVSGISPPIATLTADGVVEAIAFPLAAIDATVRENPEFGRRLRHAAIRRITGH